MVSDKALYWISAGLIAFAALNHAVTRTDLSSPLIETARQMTEELVDRGVQYAAVAQVALNDKRQCSRKQAVTAHVQAQLADLQAILAREETGMVRLESEKVHVAALNELKCAKVSLRRQNFKIEMENDPAVEASF